MLRGISLAWSAAMERALVSSKQEESYLSGVWSLTRGAWSPLALLHLPSPHQRFAQEFTEQPYPHGGVEAAQGDGV